MNPSFLFMSILRKRLQQALEYGLKVKVQTTGSGWTGIPTHLDDEFLELSFISVTTEESGVEAASTAWILRLSAIEAIALATEVWDINRLSEIPTLGKELPRE